MHIMKILSHLFIFLFGLASFCGCSPNTTLSTNPCASNNSDCSYGGDSRHVYFEVTVSPPLPTTPPNVNNGNILFQMNIGIGGPTNAIGGGYTWQSTANSYPLSTFTTDCYHLNALYQYVIFGTLQYTHPLNSTNPFVPWIGQCHSIDIKAYAQDGTLIDSWFVPSFGAFANGADQFGTLNFNLCGQQSHLYSSFGTLILPPCP